MKTTRTLYRPVRLKEMQLILEADSLTFPARLEWQPIFYPVLNFEYAAQIARDWNTKDPASDYVGIVTALDVDAGYLAQFEEHVVGGSKHRELWIPAEELDNFNEQLQGKIRIVAVHYGAAYQGKRDFDIG